MSRKNGALKTLKRGDQRSNTLLMVFFFRAPSGPFGYFPRMFSQFFAWIRKILTASNQYPRAL